LQYPSPLEQVPKISTIQHLFEANRYPQRTIKELYASKKRFRGVVVQYAGQLKALMALLQDIQKTCNLCVQPDQTLWLDELKKGKPPTMKLAFRILCFASLMGKAHDALLRVYLVPILIQKDFSVDWLANNSAEYIASQLNLLGTKPVFVKILKDVSVSIWDDHKGKVPDNLDDLLSKVPDNLEDLLSILGIRLCSACLTLQDAFNQLKMSFGTMGLSASFISFNSLDLSFFQSIVLTQMW